MCIVQLTCIASLLRIARLLCGAAEMSGVRGDLCNVLIPCLLLQARVGFSTLFEERLEVTTSPSSSSSS